METAFRETQEEAGLSKNNLNIINCPPKVLQYNVRGSPKRVVYWLAQLKDPNCSITLSNEHQDYKWLNLDEAKRYAGYSDLQTTLQEVHNYIQSTNNPS